VSNNDESFIKLMVETFLKTMPDTIKRLRQSIEEQDWENVYRTAHFAKSSLSVIKVNEVFDDVLAVAVNSKNRTNLQDIQPLFEKIEEKYSSAEALLKEKFAAKVE
jgi:HPt (histidine-containing phosphotransfer) domain-containing protein